MDSRILPADLPNTKLNDYNYEQGFDEQLLINSEYADCFSCPICHGIPRSPVIIKKCGHLFCECCIEKQFEAAKLQDINGRVLIQCAVCKGHFNDMSVLPFESFFTAMKKAYHLVRLRCPSGCPFIGDPQEMDRHQSFQCDLREVRCPSKGCEVTMPFHQLRDEHVSVCTKLMIYCESCLLPVTREHLKKHNCKERMAAAIKGISYFNLQYIFPCSIEDPSNFNLPS